MKLHDTTLADARLIDLEKRGDDRGWFARTMDARVFAEHGMDHEFVQQNASVSAQAGTLRGLHFQREPRSEAKLVRCLRGRILDVIVDLRQDSPSFLRHEGFELSAENSRMLYVPRGFAHGFQTLTDDCEVLYKVTDVYAPETEGGLLWNDPALAIDWPIAADHAVINARDAGWPGLAELGNPFPELAQGTGRP